MSTPCWLEVDGSITCHGWAAVGQRAGRNLRPGGGGQGRGGPKYRAAAASTICRFPEREQLGQDHGRRETPAGRPTRRC